ncbi:MAG: aldehyde dehydrogenase family protein [Verrucomicrobia bacterium]|nr:aldehyde dehydrogenase family protein [Verrucomicrobiota bacterium]
MKMFVANQWVDSPRMTSIIRSFNGEVVDHVPDATPAQVEQSLVAAVNGAAAMANLSAYERGQILMRAANLLAEQKDDIARTISLEEGKPISESQGEVGRMPDLLRLCAFEGSQLRGETLPVDAQSGAKNKFGLTVRVPCGIVVAITPFNYPLLLVVHKVGPALAAGNAVILKPANQTPLTALKLTKILVEAGLPENALQCLTGSGACIGAALCADERVRKL